MTEDSKLHFEVHPSVVYQLGESLITDAVQALIELVKNCYDADATYAKVIIDTEGPTDIPQAFYTASGGRIIVEDDGFGMDLEAVTDGWLTISGRKKREMKQAKQTTPGGRTPLGDKGLGRLGVQRLGENLEIFTKCQHENGYHFGFSWLDFATAPTLQAVDIHLEEIQYHRDHGTRVVVSKLREIDTWRGLKKIEQLGKELSRMISPYKQIRDFTVFVEIDGKVLELIEMTDKIRELAPVHYDITFDGSKLIVEGKARLIFFRPSQEKEVEEFALIVESDDGSSFYDYLQTQNSAKGVSLTRSRSKDWFVEYRYEKKFEDLDKIVRDDTINECIANPGPFKGEVDSFDLGSQSFRQQNIFNKISEYRRFIKELSGISVYRDGFAIRVDPDWLNLGGQWTSGGSYYGLKPENTLGYIALSARHNMDLEETTDREGFKITPYYRNFYALLEAFITFTTKTHELFGRSYVSFRKKRNAEHARVDTRKTVEDISRTIKKGLANATNHRKSLEVFRKRIETTVQDSQSVVTRLTSTDRVNPELQEKVVAVLSDLEPLLNEGRKVIGQLSGYLDELSSLTGMGQVLEDRVDSLRQQMDDMYETVALGLTAEALSHEVFNVADQLAKRTKTVQAQLRNKGMVDRTILTFIEYVHASVMALRKQMSFLSPSLRYVREQRDIINIAEYLYQLADFYQNRLSKNNISILVNQFDKEQLIIHMNKGKLSQIIDNFILNSEYWLKEEIAQRRMTKGTIVLEIKRPFIHIFDDGRGIDPTVESTLFEPFISAKARGQGRGLGLFIVKQLLDSESCVVGLLPERNKHNRFFKFQIDLRGAIYD